MASPTNPVQWGRDYEVRMQRSAYRNVLRRRYALRPWSDRLAPGRQVLDLGCGPGVTAEQLAAQGCHMVGLDLAPDFVARTRARLAPYPGSAGLQADAQHLPFAARSLDVVLGLGTLHHLARPEQALAEVARVLRPGGWLLAVEPNAAGLFSTPALYGLLLPVSWRERLIRRVAEPATPAGTCADLHVGLRTPAQYRALLEQAGLRARVRTLVLPLAPVARLGLQHSQAAWQVVVWLSQVLLALVPALRERGQVQVIEAQLPESEVHHG